jgi:hypothetical protein
MVVSTAATSRESISAVEQQQKQQPQRPNQLVVTASSSLQDLADGRPPLSRSDTGAGDKSGAETVLLSRYHMFSSAAPANVTGSAQQEYAGATTAEVQRRNKTLADERMVRVAVLSHETPKHTTTVARTTSKTLLASPPLALSLSLTSETKLSAMLVFLGLSLPTHAHD